MIMNKIIKIILVLLVVIYLLIGFWMWYTLGKPMNKLIWIITWGRVAPRAFYDVFIKGI